MKRRYRKVYEFDTDPARLDFVQLRRWLAKTYWSPGISQRQIKHGVKHSALVVGCYHQQQQVGFMRLVSDCTRFAYIMDVYVAPAHRGQGIAQNMIQFAISRPMLKNVYQWLLATQDAHGVYEKIGFAPLAVPQRWMMLKMDPKRVKRRPQV